MPGDAVRLRAPWDIVEAYDIGIIEGRVGQRSERAFVCFNARAFRGPASRQQPDEIVCCSGGPAPQLVLSKLQATGETIDVPAWRWRDGIPGAGRGEDYTIEVPVWDWLPKGATPAAPPPLRRFDPIPTGQATHRGDSPLGHQPRQVQRDLCGETIAANFGRSCVAYRRTAQQLQDCRDGKPGTGLPYEYLIYAPRSAGTSWTAFPDRAGLGAWLDAFGLTIDHEPEPGDQFTVQLPNDDSGWQQLSVR